MMLLRSQRLGFSAFSLLVSIEKIQSSARPFFPVQTTVSRVVLIYQMFFEG